MTQKTSLAAILGGLTYLLLNVSIELAFPDHWVGSPTRLLGISYAGWSRLLWLPALLILIGFMGLYKYLAYALGKLGKVAYWFIVAGFGLDILGSVLEFWVYGVFLVPFIGEFTTGSAGSQLGYEIASIGSMFSILGLLLFGIACARAALPTRWRVLPVLLSLIALSVFYFFFSSYFIIYIVLYAAIWITIGYFLRREA